MLNFIQVTVYRLTLIGPIFYLNLAGQPVVVLNTHNVAADLLGAYRSITGFYLSDRMQIVAQLSTATVHSLSWPERF